MASERAQIKYMIYVLGMFSNTIKWADLFMNIVNYQCLSMLNNIYCE